MRVVEFGVGVDGWLKIVPHSDKGRFQFLNDELAFEGHLIDPILSVQRSGLVIGTTLMWKRGNAGRWSTVISILA